MKKPILIQNGTIIDPGAKIETVADLVIDATGAHIVSKGDGHIVAGEEHISIDATNMVVCPGFIDFHCHLRQPGYEQKETIETGTKAAAQGGFTTVCCMPNLNPPTDDPDRTASIHHIAEQEAAVRVIPFGCVTINREGKTIAPLAEMAETGIAGYSDDGSPVYDEKIMRQALKENLKTGLPVSEHCEVPELAGNGVINKGKISQQLGVPGIPDAAEEEMVARDIRLAEETGGWVHIAHASTKGSVALIREAKRKGVRVTAEATPHHLTLTEDEVPEHGSQAKVNPPLRTAQDRDALIDGLVDGTIDIIATDHAPHTIEDKQEDLTKAAFGFTVFETALGSLMSLVHSGKIPLPVLIEKMTCAPAKLLVDFPEITGTIEAMSPDITIFDPYREWTVDPEEFASKGKNTPLSGKILKGKVMATIYNGGIVYRDKNL